MLRITDPKDHGKSARLDVDDNPIKIVADAFKIRMLQYDESPEPHITVIAARVDPSTLEEVGPFTQFDLRGDALIEVMTPGPNDGNRKHGDFRMSDIEAAIVKHGHIKAEIDETLPNNFESILNTVSNKRQ